MSRFVRIALPFAVLASALGASPSPLLPSGDGTSFGRPPALCSDLADNDSDGRVDFPDDPGCDGPLDTSEDTALVCLDGSDNDADGAIDFPADRSCYAESDPSENPACSNGVDDDGDGAIDFPLDADCSSVADETEHPAPACSDLADNDGDGLIDFPDDPACVAANDPSEGTLSTSVPGAARLLVALATSGSLGGDTCAGAFTGGDGSLEFPGADVACGVCSTAGCGNGLPDDSRIAQIRAGLRTFFSHADEAELALVRSHQRATLFAAPDGSPLSAAGGWQGGGLLGPGLDSGDLLVVFSGDNDRELAGYADGQANAPSGTPPPGADFELRASGRRPLAGLLTSAGDAIAAAASNDFAAACRPYAVILIADGGDECSGAGCTSDAPAAAAALATAGADVWVIGFAAAGDQVAALDAIATAGASGAPVFVNDQAGLVSALDQIAAQSALVELCNGLDDNCDGQADELFPQKGASCSNGLLGACAAAGNLVCATDHSLACDGVASGPSPETCNGIDDDCDGEVDESGVCDPGIELCNGLDDDGDNEFDEGYPVGLPCSDGQLGVCRGSGTYVCAPDGLSAVCSITSPGAAPSVDDDCDGLDDDCDGQVDEHSIGDMIHVSFADQNFWIDRYEASRPGATSSDEGYLGARACSRPNVLPWRMVTKAEAAAACAATGKQLCSETQWQSACAGAGGKQFPYGNVYDPQACNGEDFDPDCAGADDDELLPTGTPFGCPAPPQSACASSDGVLDLSGNLAEWSATSSAPGSLRVLGGSYLSPEPALTCFGDTRALPADSVLPTLGFRCCSETAPNPFLIFRDDFEQNSTAAWSATVP